MQNNWEVLELENPPAVILKRSDKTEKAAVRELSRRPAGFESILAIANNERIAEFKFRWSDNPAGSVCHCLIFIKNQVIGYGRAGGYGYDKQTAALIAAFESLGIPENGGEASTEYQITRNLVSLGFGDFELIKVWF